MLGHLSTLAAIFSITVGSFAGNMTAQWMRNRRKLYHCERAWVRITDSTPWRLATVIEPLDPRHSEYRISIDGNAAELRDPENIAGRIFIVKARNVRRYKP